MLTFVFRIPEYPIICNIDGYLIAAKDEDSFVNELKGIPGELEKSYDLLDAAGEGWLFLTEHMAISPLTIKKKWLKKELIALFNNRKNTPGEAKYSEKSLSSKRFDRIFMEIVELLSN
jgi:hypothetical protein